MIEPLQALLIAGKKNQARVALGQSSISIREGVRNYRVGEKIMLCCHLTNWVVMADVKEVRHCQLMKLTYEELEANEFNNVDDALFKMRKFYPKIGYASFVTVIRWNLCEE